MIKTININDIKYKIKQLTNTKWKKFLIVIFSILFFNSCYYLITGKNIIERNIKALLYKAGVYTEEVRKVEINSPGWINAEDGSWNLNKSASWIDINKAQVTIELNSKIKKANKYRDVIFVLDISGSMGGEKIERVKKDAIELTDYLLSDSNNKVALITFDSNSSIISNLTNNQDLIINSINNLSVTGVTNYSAALKNVSNLLNDYQYDNNRELIVLFLTDGYPNTETPNQISQYKYLKQQYPYIFIEGIQYEMGEDIINEIIEISDVQYLAHLENLNNVLFEAALLPESYELFEITDYIDNEYFQILSEDDIQVDIGNFKLENENGQQKIIWNLGENSYKTGSSVQMKINLSLKERYQFNNGLYPTNTHEIIKSKLADSNEETINSTKTPVLKNGYKITYDTNEPQGCRLKSISDEMHFAFETVEKRRDELLCPGYIFKGWEVEEDINYINDDTFIMPPQDITIRGVWTSQNISKSMYGTIHEKATLYRKVKSDYEKGINGAKLVTSTINDNYKIYYYNSNSNNHVYFANNCWQIVRTTETGGVKLIYEGKPTNNTCENPDQSAIPKSAYNSPGKSLAEVGYMYNKIYNTESQYIQHQAYKINQMITGSNFTVFGDTYTLSNGKYTIKNKDGSPVEKSSWSDKYENVKGYYSCYYQDSDTCSELYYITGGDKYYAYALELTNNANIEDVNTEINIGLSYTKNSDGTYTLNDITTIKKSDWYSGYQNYINQYVCEDQTESICNEVNVILETSDERYMIAESATNSPEKDNLYGNSFTYDGTNYHLVDTIKADTWSNTYNNLDNNHYTCFNTTGVCDKIYYLVNTRIDYKYYYELTDGKGINEIINEMLYDNDVNKINSAAKDTLDKWYEDNLIDYTNQIEDTIYCNNRNIYELDSLNPNGGSLSTTNIYFVDSKTPSLTCSNLTDRFTVSKDNGNGALKYPIGLLTRKEAQLIGEKVAGTIPSNWLLSPYRFLPSASSFSITYRYTGKLSYNSGSSSQYVVPVISLKNDIGYLSGNGSPTKPYIIE